MTPRPGDQSMTDALQLAQHNANQLRFASLETSAKETLALLNDQRVLLATIIEQTKEIPDIKQDIKDTNERVDTLESKADKITGAKTLLMFLVAVIGATVEHFISKLFK